MIKTSLPLYLASKSPRRKKLLEQINLNFKVIDVDSDEKIRKSESPVVNAKRIAAEKMERARSIIKEGLIITADTIVVLDNKILGKPADRKAAAKMLGMLSGRTHYVVTGFAIYNTHTRKMFLDYEKTLVTFRKLGSKEIEEYIKSGSPLDKAGAYGIQDDYGAVFIKKINGCYYNVVGLPLAKVYDTLMKAI